AVLQELFDRIEADEFWAAVNVASDERAFLRGVELQPEVQQLHKRLSSPATWEEVYRHAIELVKREADPNYANPWATPVTVYLAALDHHTKNLANILAESLRDREGFWWARRVAERILSEQGFATESAVTTVPEPSPGRRGYAAV